MHHSGAGSVANDLPGAYVSGMDTSIPDGPAPSGAHDAVSVEPDLLRAAMERTGIDDPEELVSFALKLLLEPDSSADYSRRTRGANPGFDLDI